jgi:predicted  nucleic acid-binding Zn-ribbon protein
VVQQAHEELVKLRAECRELEDRLATLEGQHKTLRGRFYATRSEPEGRPESPGETREARKAAALGRLGHPIIHPKGNT